MFSIGKMFRKDQPDVSGLLQEGARVIDVRTTDEFKSGHAAGSTNIPLDELVSRLPEIKSWKSPVITLCRSGARSSAGADLLRKAGVDAHDGGGWTEFETRRKSG